MNVLFVTWDGPQVVYLESLFVPIFVRLKRRGFRVHVLQFTWGDGNDDGQRACREAAIPFRRINVWRGLGAGGGFLSALFGGDEVRRAILGWSIDLIMPRSLLPALAVRSACCRPDLPVLFDADGLPADERVEFAGLSPTGLVYCVLRRIEASAVRRADAVLVRTEKAAEILSGRTQVERDVFHVVCNGRDPYLFRPLPDPDRDEVRRKLGFSPSSVVGVYSGSLGVQYCLEESLRLIAQMRGKGIDARLLVLSRSSDLAAEYIKRALPEAVGWSVIVSVQPQEMPCYLAAADFGIALRRPSFSMQAVSPIKLGEFLLCGLPVVGTEGIGDTGEAVRRGVFRAVMLGSAADYDDVADWIRSIGSEPQTVRQTARQVGLLSFSIERSEEQYASALEAVSRGGRRFTQGVG